MPDRWKSEIGNRSSRVGRGTTPTKSQTRFLWWHSCRVAPCELAAYRLPGRHGPVGFSTTAKADNSGLDEPRSVSMRIVFVTLPISWPARNVTGMTWMVLAAGFFSWPNRNDLSSQATERTRKGLLARTTSDLVVC